MRIIKIVFLLLLPLAVTLFAARVLILNKLTALALQKGGAEEISVQFSAVGFKQTDIDNLRATFRLPSGDLLPVSLRKVSLHYSFPQLLATGKCKRVSISVMEINRTEVNKATASSLSLPEHISLLKDDLRSRLPLGQLHIDRLRLNGGIALLLADKDIQLNTVVNETSITTAINLQITEDTLVTVDLRSPDASQGTLNISGRQGQAEILQARVNLTPKALSAKIAVQMGPVRDLLLPQADIPALPIIEGKVDATFDLPLPLQDSSNMQAAFTLKDKNGSLLQLDADGSLITRQLSLNFNGKYKEQEFLNTILKIGAQRINGSYQLTAGPLRSFLQPYLEQAIPEISGTLAGTLNLPFPGPGSKAFTLTGLASRAAVSSFNISSAEVALTGEVTDSAILLDQASVLHIKNLVLVGNKINELSLDLAGDFKRIEERLLLDFAGQQKIQFKGVTTGKVYIDEIRLQPENPLQVFIHKRIWSVTANTLHAQPMLIAEGTRNYRTGPLTCTFSSLEDTGSGPTLSSKVTAPSFIYQDKDSALPLKNLSGAFLFKDNLINGKMQFSPETLAGMVKADFTHSLATAAGSFRLWSEKPFDLNQQQISLANLYSPWPFPFNLDSGMLSFKTSGSWAPRKKLNLSAFTAVTGGSGIYKQFLFKGLDIRQDLAVLPRLYSKTEGNFSLQQLIGGIDVHDIRAGLNFLPSENGPLPQVQLNNISASLFDGTITSPAMSYDLNQPDSNFTVNIEKMNLNTLIKLIKMEDLHVTGRISGTLPVTVRGKEISVANGELHNELPGGEIRYTPSKMSHEGLTGYALKAVEDFRYNSLKTTARYLPSGQLDLDIGLQGISPGLETSRPVHLNIHAEQNLPALLQSLRYSKGVTEELDKRLKQHYN